MLTTVFLNTNSSILRADNLGVYPASLVFNAVQGHPYSQTLSVFIFSSEGTSLSWTASKSATWLTTESSSGVSESVLKVGVNVTGLNPGIYHGNIVISSAESVSGSVTAAVTLIVNPDVPVSVSTWKDGYPAAMSASIDSRPTGFDVLQLNGFSGTYFFRGDVPDAYLTDYYNAGMEIGSHTINHTCTDIPDNDFRHNELEPNILAICSQTPEPCRDVISFDWPCGYTSYHMQAVASEYFLSTRGYNINELEDATPQNFMNLKCYNSHEHTPYPPADLRQVIDQAVTEKKWFNEVLHEMNDAFTADINYAHTKNIWVANIGTVIKYILQRDRFILTGYNFSGDTFTFNVSRLDLPATVYRSFENAFGNGDLSTISVDIDDSKTIDHVLVDGLSNAYQLKEVDGNMMLFTNIKLDPSKTKSVEIKYLSSSLPVTITGVTAQNKVYDGTTEATINSGAAVLSGVVAGDNVVLIKTAALGSFESKTAGTGKNVNISGFALGGTDAGKYSLKQPKTTANISSASLTISGVSVNDKVYDGLRTANLNISDATLAGILGSDQVILGSTSATGLFADKNVGQNKLVTISGFTLQGTDAGNYSLTQPSSVAGISARELTIAGVSANSKIYDGNTTATLNAGSASLSGPIAGDNVTLRSSGASGLFTSKNAGQNIPVTISGFTLSGTDAVNYTLTQPQTTASISVKNVTVNGVTAVNKVYDATRTAIVNSSGALLSGTVAGDDVTLIKTGLTALFDTKNIGTGKAVTIAGLSLAGADKNNYSLVQPTAQANVTIATLTITGLSATNKVYDGTTGVSLIKTGLLLNGVFGSDGVTVVTAAATGIFSDKSSGAAKVVTTTGFVLAGADAANYSLVQPQCTASITKAPITISGVSVSDKVYDGTVSSVLSTGSAILTGAIGSDNISISSAGARAVFADQNVGSNKAVLISGFEMTGGDSGNYILTQPSLTANILPASVVISAENKMRRFGEQNPQLTFTCNGFVQGEDQHVLSKIPSLETSANQNSDAGEYDVIPSGAAAVNYIFSYRNGILTIEKADQEISFASIPAGLRMTQKAKLSATSGSGLPVSFEVADPATASIDGDELTILKDGEIVVKAMQGGDHNWNPAPDVIQRLEALASNDNIPSLFTPNNDGINDFWYLSGLDDFGKIQVTIYNRFGQSVYRSDAYKNDWDGTWNGNPLPSAAYYYIIKSSTKGFIKGVVNIVR